MLKNKKINLGVVRKVAHALGELNEQVAYVGGATVSLYADDPAADDVRPTKDIDIVLRIANFGELTDLQEKLGQKGIYPDPGSKVVCRFTFEDVLIDVMSTKEVVWAPSDPWFEPGFRNLLAYQIDEEISIKIFPVGYFLATKFSAFSDRGGDPRTSKDFEDIVYVLDNRVDLVNELKASDPKVREFLRGHLLKFLHKEMDEAISAHLSRFSEEDRLTMLRDKLKVILG
jgi:predicted nucleotidyltransferase